VIDEYILDAEELPEFELQDASKFLRLANYILDYIAFLMSSVLFFLFAGFSMVSFGGEVDDSAFMQSMLFIGWYLGYFVLSEWLFKGRTIAKFITRTRAVKESGYQIAFKDALLRSLCRLIPLEPFAYLLLNKPWHDSLTNTRVVDWPKR